MYIRSLSNQLCITILVSHNPFQTRTPSMVIQPAPALLRFSLRAFSCSPWIRRRRFLVRLGTGVFRNDHWHGQSPCATSGAVSKWGALFWRQTCHSKTKKGHLILRQLHRFQHSCIHKRDEQTYLQGLWVIFTLTCYGHVPNWTISPI